MAFQVCETDIANYYRDGYIVFKHILPTALINDLRRECDKAVLIARQSRGPQAQRLQPVSAHESTLNLKPFRDYAELPDLCDAVHQVLSPQHFYGRLDVFGILLEPANEPWCTAWHRDMTLKTSRLPAEEFQDIMLDWNSANQINCPLYDDECTWFVPGSHLRARDLPGESAAASAGPPGPVVGDTGEKNPAEQERRCDLYTRSMPGAVQLRLSAGDFAMYRPIGWHIGNYVPYKKRATLHDAVFTPVYEKWWREWIKGGSPRWSRAVNP